MRQRTDFCRSRRRAPMGYPPWISVATSLLAWLVLAGASPHAQAHPGHARRKPVSPPPPFAASPLARETASRDWDSADGALRERGTFVMAREGFVQIRRDDDTLVLLPVGRLEPDDQDWIASRQSEIQRAADRDARSVSGPLSGDRPQSVIIPGDVPWEPDGAGVPVGLLALAAIQRKSRGGAVAAPEIARAFDEFVRLKAIRTRWDDRWFYVESNGIPDHPLMIGITAWQQQVPIPQKYTGENAWQIPLIPVPARQPQSTKGRFLRGAIAVAVNGIPIFNPLNNRGDDAYLFGELDEYGGHCGRADDYHYHLAPVHLEKTVGAGQPIAYALDGYPIHGYTEPDGSEVRGLDEFNGHHDAKGQYHYHATRKYPYLNGGFHGEVTEREGQVDPQPRAEPIRPDLRPLRDARITGFEQLRPGSYRLTYEVQGKPGTVSYTLADDGSAEFVFVDPRGHRTSETYSPARRRPGGGGKGDRRPPPRGGQRPPRRDGNAPRENDATTSAHQDAGVPREASRSDRPRLTLSSSSVDSQGRLSIDCTCDGKGRSPAVRWNEAPQGTVSFAISLWHTAPDQEKSCWVLYNIPADVSSLAENSQSVGRLGLNDRRQAAYEPMCSKGPGLKTYHLTVYALSAELELPRDKATRASLLEAIRGITLAEGTLDFQHERSGRG